MQDTKFLQQVAEYYINSGVDLTNIVIVSPNRRSSMFLRRYMQKATIRNTFMPRMVSITYFTQQFCESTLADNTELIIILFKSYCKVLKRHGKESQIPDFDHFYFWGNVLLKDFSEVDAYMVDADQLFSNLKNYREIKANYLTEEQIEVIEHLWGPGSSSHDIEHFWQHMPESPDAEAPSGKFLSLWEIMSELYHEFRKELSQQNPPLAYSGMLSREAYNTIKGMGRDDFRGKRYVFVGFNVLSTARTLIFKRLQKLGLADFFWDTASPFLRDKSGASTNAGHLILPLAKAFPMPEDFKLEPITTAPDIEIIAMPSNTGQAKLASKIIEEWKPLWTPLPGAAPSQDLIDTAVVMPDAQLLTPMLYAIPEDIDSINVTMSVTYNSTPFAALMSSIISMHLRDRIIRGEHHYFHQDVTNILSNAHITIIAPKEADLIKEKIVTGHLTNISVSELINDAPTLAFIFTPISDARDIASVKAYITTLVHTLTDYMKKACSATVRAEEPYELTILEGYAHTVETLCSMIQKHDVKLQERTFLQIIERTVSAIPIELTGDPLRGLQLMGVMDTRALDFKNLIFTSMNERIFPKRNFNPSLIPANLRSGYYMPTQEHEENSYAYQFFRLISRAQNVKLIYDSRTAGITSGEMSRYLLQLLHIAGKDHTSPRVSTSIVEMTPEMPEIQEVVVHKTPEVCQELRGFREKGGPRLSASALKTYLSCPLKFYLQYVKNFRVQDELVEYIDAASYGTVIHRIAQDLYLPFKGKLVTDAVIDNMLHINFIERALDVLNKEYYKGRYDNRLDLMPGEAQIVAKIIAQYIKCMLREEKKMTPFTFYGAEVGEHKTCEWRVNDKYTLNFTMSIDRIDVLQNTADFKDNTLRFIDYKTGSDELRFSKVEDLFDDPSRGGIFQLLTYSRAYCDIYGHRGPIKPMIYKFVTMPKEGIDGLVYNKKEINDYRDVEGFNEMFEDLIDRIFEEDDNYPFCQSEKDDHCLYCPFKQVCQRFPEKSY